MYASSATHFSITKAAALLGIGRKNVQQVAVDEHFKMRIDDLVAKITADMEAGYIPFCVVGNAGTVDTGAVDPLTEIREVANRFQLWMHVDGSYGAFAVLAESARKLFAGMEHADSIALDPHKWLYLPVDVACVIYRDPEMPAPLLLMRRNTLACLVRRKTRPLCAGTTDRNCRGVSGHSKFGCC
jgi:glutamate/tyrosine decarboxylase-like PLP-dependent enzyme